MSILTLLSRINLARKIRNAERDIRRTHADAERSPDRAAYYHGEVLPHLSLRLANLQLTQRRAKQQHMPTLKNMPVLGQVGQKPNLRLV